jgi:tetratricopeptide (TPR) repeat protein
MPAAMNGWARAVLPWGLGVMILVAHPPSAHAQSGEPTPEAVASAKAHFAKGRALYQAGSYREAIMELDAARALDPKAKDLVFNLAVVHEKLAEIDEALRYARLYGEMDLEPAERVRAESYIKRLEGAKSEVEAKKASVAGPVPPGGGGAAPDGRVRGRIDVVTISVAGVAAVAAVAGVVFGVKALADKAGNTTSATVSYQDLVNSQHSAHTDAVVADVCFGGAVVAAGVAAGLYFLRYRDDAPPPSKQSRSLTVAPFVQPSIGGLLVGGTF